MSQKVHMKLKDDLDGGPVDTTLTFTLDERDYEINLSNTNAERLREDLRLFVSAAREASAGNGHRKRATGTSISFGETAAIRAWAKGHGH